MAFLPEDIDPIGIRALARNLFSGFYERGVTARDAYRELEEAGLSYNRAQFLTDFAKDNPAYKQAIHIRNVNLDKTPSERILQPRYFGVPDKYSFVFKVTGINETTGNTQVRHFFYHTSDMNTRGEIEDDALDWLVNESEGASGQGFSPESIQIAEGYINPIWAED